MRRRFLYALIISTLPVLAYADITVDNNTNSSGSGKFYYSPCSSVVPNGRGIIHPHQQGFTIPSFIIKMFCGNSDCQAYIYNSTDCSGDVAGTAVINADNGVIGTPTYDKKVYKVTGSGNKLTIDPVDKQQGVWGWFKSFF